jgi:uncharacterized delta-60 repeat protein
MKLRYVFLFLTGFLFQNLYAQPALAWSQRYNGPPDYGDEARAIDVDNAGNVYVTGSAFSNNGTLDIVTIKYSATGQQLWLQSYNGTANDNDEGYDIQVSDSGNVYVAGYSKTMSGGQDITIIKYSGAGVQQWVNIYNGSFSSLDLANALAVDANGNAYVIGYETVSNLTLDFVTIKYSTGGAQMWAQTYNGPGNFNDEGRDIALDASGNVFVTGPSDTLVSSQPNSDMVLLKYNNAGSLQWRRAYNSPGNGYEYSKYVAVDANNDIVMAGYGFVTGNGNDFYAVKYSNSGSFQWVQNYNYAANTFEQPNGLVIDSQNNIIIAGQGVTSTQLGTNDYVTVKYNSAGTFQWASRYDNGSNGEDRAYGIAVGDSSQLYVTGFSAGSGTMQDIATVKYDASGAQVYVLRFNHTANKDDVGNAVAFKNGDIYVTGLSNNPTNGDYITLRYSYSAIGISETNAPVANLNAFPNPATNFVNILVPSTAKPTYTVVMTNALGQIINTSSVNASESTGDKDLLRVSTLDLTSGVYFLHIEQNGIKIGTARIVVE